MSKRKAASPKKKGQEEEEEEQFDDEDIEEMKRKIAEMEAEEARLCSMERVVSKRPIPEI